MNKLTLKLNNHFYILVFLAAAVYFYAALFVFEVQGDVQKHLGVVWMILHGKDFPPNFLYFVTVGAVAFFQDDYKVMLFASLLVLSAAVAGKFYFTVKFCAVRLETIDGWNQNKSYFVSNIIGLCLITAVCIYLPKEIGLTDYFMLGQIPLNVWHNSTTIFLMPFAILLFWYSSELLEEFTTKRLWLVIGLVTVNILIKPSFFLCVGAVFPLLALNRFRLKREFFLCMLPVIWGLVLMALEYIVIYKLGSYGTSSESGIIIAPFIWWKIYSLNIPISLLVSTAFPLIYSIFYYKRIADEPTLYYAYLLFIVGLAFLAFVNETGTRATHGNFQWQAIISNYILFFAVSVNFAQNVLQNRIFNVKDKIIVAVFALHLFSGWLYMAKTLVRGNYG